ncbi:MAG: sterol desaturase family protein [Alphaproteobacteria bacterium]|jgi:hypothetical protein|nr:sterol desaturase family protein [Alphaproteobacteria bacterium]MDP6518080.1 sterol desaturase family protein [Alphaproteobacteria bacterium]
MELAISDMTARQRAYRSEYRHRIDGWYHGPLHVAVIYTIGIAAWYIFISHIQAVQWWEWLTIPVVALASNLFEWFLHRQVMHRPQKLPALKAIYTRHTLMHHQFFTDREMRFAGPLDWRVTFFPPYALVVFILMSIPAALAAGWVISANTGWLVMCATTGMYMIYEFMHFCCHVEEGWFVRTCPLVNTIRRHHAAHHDQSIMMERNMNLTFPIADWLFGTSDLDRGLLGHLFNGYDTRHLRTDLRRASRTPDGHARPAPA